MSAFGGKADIIWNMDVHQCPLLTLSGHQSSISPDWSPVGSACYFLIIIVIRHETASAARWALLLIVRTLFDHAITVAVRTGFSFHVCLPADIFASLTRQPNVMHRGSIASFVMWGTWAWCTTGILLRRGMSAFDPKQTFDLELVATQK
jgi:hypothetical protein